tara:strand:- start:1437 stop:1730 length:294 start_codon:yes stop_codon:yes gene_type:complete
MAVKKTSLTHIKKLIKQISGNFKELDEIYPEVMIRGKGYISCYCPLDKMFIKVRRGTTVYIVDVEDEDKGDDKVLVYTILGNLIEIEEDELITIGFD